MNSKKHRIHIVADDLIFPTNSGGRAEVLGHTNALKKSGHQVNVTMMQREEVSDENLKLNLQYADYVQILKRTSLIESTIRYPFKPYQLASRIFSENEANKVPKCDIVIAHHEYAIPYAEKIAKRHSALLLLRSHNDEIKYTKSLLKANSSAIKKLYFACELIRGKINFRKKFYKNVNNTLLISPEDAEFYRSRRVKHTYVPPSLLSDNKLVKLKPPQHKSHNIIFAGTLDVSITREGLKWFINQVLPSVREQFPDAKLIIMGRRAPKEFEVELSGNEAVLYLGEVNSVEKELVKARAFINPVFGGSGVNMKLGPPASIGLPIVSTVFGTRGLGTLRDNILVADSEKEFSDNIIKLLANDQYWLKISNALQSEIKKFSFEEISKITLRAKEI